MVEKVVVTSYMEVAASELARDDTFKTVNMLNVKLKLKLACNRH